MGAVGIGKPKTFLGKAFWVATRRPTKLMAELQRVLLFLGARLVRLALPLPGVEFGLNVRLQRNRSVMAEAPHAVIKLGDDGIIYEFAKIEAYGNGKICIGAQSVIGDARIYSRNSISIGKRFLSSWNVFISDFDAHPVDPHLRGLQVQEIVDSFWPRFDKNEKRSLRSELHSELDSWNFPSEPVIIGDDVWLGANVTILKGAEIGDGCIVAAGSVVLRGQYLAGSLIAGNPAVVVKKGGDLGHPRF
jgi:acetyltransferase-like isoleucine patch superfamily enzyme